MTMMKVKSIMAFRNNNGKWEEIEFAYARMHDAVEQLSKAASKPSFSFFGTFTASFIAIDDNTEETLRSLRIALRKKPKIQPWQSAGKRKKPRVK